MADKTTSSSSPPEPKRRSHSRSRTAMTPDTLGIQKSRETLDPQDPPDRTVVSQLRRENELLKQELAKVRVQSSARDSAPRKRSSSKKHNELAVHTNGRGTEDAKKKKTKTTDPEAAAKVKTGGRVRTSRAMAHLLDDPVGFLRGDEFGVPPRGYPDRMELPPCLVSDPRRDPDEDA